MLELCGTFAEVYTADVLLQGRTNADDLLLTVRWLRKHLVLFFKRNKTRVQPDPSQEAHRSLYRSKRMNPRRTTFAAGDVLIESSTKSFTTKKKIHQRSVFCATAMIMNTITEASGLVVGSLFWICCKANPSTSDGRSLNLSQALSNFAIMLFGELILSDFIVAYTSHFFSSRYIISIANEWEHFRETQNFTKNSFIVIMSLISSAVILQIPMNLCVTGSTKEWALTQCPEAF